MPIVSISQLQQRHGLQENLPQLSAAEFGWSLDTRRLFIGNGPVSEGAPTVGNTEILTEHSDILNNASTYTYQGDAAGYTHVTGVDASSPVTRTLQSKLDDIVSVRDFGAVGDGVTDDTAAINRAFRELFCREVNEEIRRTLLFPAGIYIVTDVVKIPPYAKIVGEGKQSSIIERIIDDSTAGPVAKLSDSLQQIDSNLGTNGALLPSFVEIFGMTFKNSTDANVFEVDLATDCRFESVRFRGNSSVAPSAVGNSEAVLTLTSTAIAQTKAIVFEQCEFSGSVFGVVADNDMQHIVFNACRFRDLYKAIKLGENTTSSGASLLGPRSIRITNGLFDNIYNTAIHVYAISDIVSAFNHFQNVGNTLAGASNPAASVIIFGGNNNSSICDIFDRDDTDAAVYPRVEYLGQDAFVLDPGDSLRYGRTRTEPGRAVTLVDNSVDANSGISFSATNEKTNLIYYTAERGSNVRHGIIKVAASATGNTISDEYNYDGSDIGLTFSVSVAAGVTQLRYTTTSTGNNVTMKYRVERMI